MTSTKPSRPVFPSAAVLAAESDVADIRMLSEEQRGQLLISVCRDAAAIEQGRLQSGLPPSSPAPWPKSTWDFLKRNAARARSETA